MEFVDDSDEVRFGVMKPDGREILSMDNISSISPATENGSITAFITNTRTVYGQFIDAIYTPAVYTILNPDGHLISTGAGVMRYEEAPELFSVQGTDFFAWLDKQGNTLISIPSMAYSFD